MDQLKGSFEAIAENIGSDAVIARGFQERIWSSELLDKYFGNLGSEMHSYLPAVLVTTDHPEQLSDWSLRVLIPLKLAEEKFGDMPAFFRTLVNFSRRQDSLLLDTLKERNPKAKALNRIIKAKPGLLGINIDLNAFADMLFERRQ